MNLNVVTAIGTVIGVAISLWTIMSNFDKRNSDRFDGLQKQIDATQRQIEATKETLRAEMREMRPELRLEIRDAADRRVR